MILLRRALNSMICWFVEAQVGNLHFDSLDKQLRPRLQAQG